ncbi:uncharacterized protein B0I36DRAFT_364425 [Microdochium trichocladiopsis]|uniref:F-box domain-containing protein n=1 Tax=Microdochium trichocladiopsis TaxID=1682393 RepID=A0A9P8Y0Z4_9PEZI|nr:uncharacterized protein B0I36DRAFT_364425 [Microdochium trichocladiopsis]KAH7027180.1 hypothetical protein B0I36DRAFT_364425 [Microdochium trichocladiopsis]
MFAELPTELILAVSNYLPLLDQVSLAAANHRIQALSRYQIARLALRQFPYLIVWAAEVGFHDLVETFLLLGGSPNTSFETYIAMPKRNNIRQVEQRKGLLNRVYKHHNLFAYYKDPDHRPLPGELHGSLTEQPFKGYRERSPDCSAAEPYLVVDT